MFFLEDVSGPLCSPEIFSSPVLYLQGWIWGFWAPACDAIAGRNMSSIERTSSRCRKCCNGVEPFGVEEQEG